MFYDFNWDITLWKQQKNICCAKGQVDFETILQTIEANLVSSFQRVSVEHDISQASVACHLLPQEQFEEYSRDNHRR